MALPVGTRIGVHEIVARLGAGGMGEVYRARDTKLGRDVAIKILPRAFARDPERLRALRARSAAARLAQSSAHRRDLRLRGDADGVAALVMELVEGETLADAHRAEGRCRSPRRCRSRGRSPMRSTPRTSRASSIAI